MNAEFIEPAWHEFVVNLVFDDRGACCQHGLEPFYAAEKIIRSSQGSRRARGTPPEGTKKFVGQVQL